MGDDQTTPDRPAESTDAGNVPARLRRLIAAHQNRLPSKLRVRGRLITAAYGVLVAFNLIGIAAAQAGGGGGGSIGAELCGTAIAETINEVAPLALAAVVIGGLILAYLLHGYAGFKKDPDQVKFVKDWRNRAGVSAVTAPLLGKLLEIIIGFVIGIPGCIDIVPGI